VWLLLNVVIEEGVSHNTRKQEPTFPNQTHLLPNSVHELKNEPIPKVDVPKLMAFIYDVIPDVAQA
jgi:hypothetical protein